MKTTNNGTLIFALVLMLVGFGGYSILSIYQIPDKKIPKLKTQVKVDVVSWKGLYPDMSINEIIDATKEKSSPRKGARADEAQRDYNICTAERMLDGDIVNFCLYDGKVTEIKMDYISLKKLKIFNDFFKTNDEYKLTHHSSSAIIYMSKDNKYKVYLFGYSGNSLMEWKNVKTQKKFDEQINEMFPPTISKKLFED